MITVSTNKQEQVIYPHFASPLYCKCKHNWLFASDRLNKKEFKYKNV